MNNDGLNEVEDGWMNELDTFIYLFIYLLFHVVNLLGRK